MKKLRLPKNEKEQRICELIKQRKQVREIAKEVRVSFSEIKRIREKYFEKDDGDVPQNSKRSQALTLIDEGKSDLEIAIELDLSSEEMLGYRQEYLTLKADDDLLLIYRRIGPGGMEPYVKIYESMRQEHKSPEEALWALEEYGLFENIEKEFTRRTKMLRVLREDVKQAENQKQALTRENIELTALNHKLKLDNQGLHGEILDKFKECVKTLDDSTNNALDDLDMTEFKKSLLELEEGQARMKAKQAKF